MANTSLSITRPLYDLKKKKSSGARLIVSETPNTLDIALKDISKLQCLGSGQDLLSRARGQVICRFCICTGTLLGSHARSMLQFSSYTA